MNTGFLNLLFYMAIFVMAICGFIMLVDFSLKGMSVQRGIFGSLAINKNRFKYIFIVHIAIAGLLNFIALYLALPFIAAVALTVGEFPLWVEIIVYTINPLSSLLKLIAPIELYSLFEIALMWNVLDSLFFAIVLELLLVKIEKGHENNEGFNA